MIIAVFWLSISVVIYAYVGYPIVIWCCARWWGRSHVPQPIEERVLPKVSVLVAAHNEEFVIGRRIRNLTQSVYPSSKLEVVVASDGSSDGTNEIVAGYASCGVRLLAYAERRGKAEVLNDSIPQLAGEIVVFSDANTEFAPNAIAALARWFNDPGVGVVCGALYLQSPNHGKNVDNLYWKYENFLKRCEGRLEALPGANGAIYAVRKACLFRLPVRTTVDDMIIPLRAKILSGCTILYDPAAMAVEEITPDLKSEFRRRCRNGAGAYQSLIFLFPLLHPRFGWTSFAFISHKVCRLLAPFCLGAMLLTNAAALDTALYRALFVVQLAFYSLATIGLFWPFHDLYSKAIRLCTLFAGMNLALLLGLFLWLAGRQRGTWRPTNRAETA